MPSVMLAGAGETMQYIVHDYNDNTIRFVLRYPGHVDAALLSRAVRAVVDRVDILHASFHPGKLRGWWKVNANVREESYFTVSQEANPMEAALARAVLPVCPGDECQLRCSLVQGPEEDVLVVTISHLCVDGVDGKYLLGKLAEAYRLLRETGSADGLAVKNGSRAAEQVYEHLSRQEKRRISRSPMSGVKSEFPYPTAEEGTPRLTLRAIPAQVMEKARLRAREDGASMNDLLLAACYHAFAKMPGVDAHAPMSIMGMMDLRKHCAGGDSAGLCNMAGTLYTTLPNGPGKTLDETLALVVRQTRAAKEEPLAGLTGLPLIHGASKALPLGVLLRCVGAIYGSFSIGLTNLGNMDGDLLALDGLKPAEGVFGGPLKKKPGMQISAASFGGACSLCVAGQYTKEDQALLQSLLDSMAETIGQYAAKA